VDNVYIVDKQEKAFKMAKAVARLCTKKSTYLFHEEVNEYVDCVDKLLAKEVFADIYNVSRSHSYQQIAVDTIF